MGRHRGYLQWQPVDKGAKFMNFELVYNLLRALVPTEASLMHSGTRLMRQATIRVCRYGPDDGHAACLTAAREDQKAFFKTVKSDLANVLEPTYAKLNNAVTPWRKDGNMSRRTVCAGTRLVILRPRTVFFGVSSRLP